MKRTPMVEGLLGPLEILPASMWPGLTRNGLSQKSWQAVEKNATDFLLTASGVWLPSTTVSESDHNNLLNEYTNNAAQVSAQKRQRILNALGALSSNESGCWIDNSDDVVELVRNLTETELAYRKNTVGATIIESELQTPLRKVCDHASCINPRHYDHAFTPASGRKDLLYIDANFFQAEPAERGGEVITAWGNRLPSVETSRQELRNFQLRCKPYTGNDVSPLSISGIAQLQLIPATGCWLTQTYYMTPVGIGGYENWQYDGYGRLRPPSGTAKKYGLQSEARLAHRVTWRLSGNKLKSERSGFVLNHKCGFRPCANYLHLEQVPYTTNSTHGYMMDVAGFMLGGDMSIKDGLEKLKQAAKSQPDIKSTDIDKFWH